MNQKETPMILWGTAGEHVVCADLILRGFPAFMTSAGLSYDVVCQIAGRTVKMAVRSTLKARPRSGRKLTRSCYQFSTLRSAKTRYSVRDVDIIAFVALDTKEVAYRACRNCPTILHLDVSGERLYPNRKGPKRGECKTFRDFTLETALAEAFS